MNDPQPHRPPSPSPPLKTNRVTITRKVRRCNWELVGNILLGVFGFLDMGAILALNFWGLAKTERVVVDCIVVNLFLGMIYISIVLGFTCPATPPSTNRELFPFSVLGLICYHLHALVLLLGLLEVYSLMVWKVLAVLTTTSPFLFLGWLFLQHMLWPCLKSSYYRLSHLFRSSHLVIAPEDLKTIPLHGYYSHHACCICGIQIGGPTLQSIRVRDETWKPVHADCLKKYEHPKKFWDYGDPEKPTMEGILDLEGRVVQTWHPFRIFLFLWFPIFVVTNIWAWYDSYHDEELRAYGVGMGMTIYFIVYIITFFSISLREDPWVEKKESQSCYRAFPDTDTSFCVLFSNRKLSQGWLVFLYIVVPFLSHLSSNLMVIGIARRGWNFPFHWKFVTYGWLGGYGVMLVGYLLTAIPYLLYLIGPALGRLIDHCCPQKEITEEVEFPVGASTPSSVMSEPEPIGQPKETV